MFKSNQLKRLSTTITDHFTSHVNEISLQWRIQKIIYFSKVTKWQFWRHLCQPYEIPPNATTATKKCKGLLTNFLTFVFFVFPKLWFATRQINHSLSLFQIFDSQKKPFQSLLKLFFWIFAKFQINIFFLLKVIEATERQRGFIDCLPCHMRCWYPLDFLLNYPASKCFIICGYDGS